VKIDFIQLMEVSDKIEILYGSRAGEQLILSSTIIAIHNENKFSISVPIYRAKVFSISRGERFVIRYCKRNAGIYTFGVLAVKKTKEHNIMALELLRISDVKKAQRREFYRLSIVQDVELCVVDENQEVKYIDEANQIIDDSEAECIKGVLKDISGGGMRVLTKAPMELGLEVESSFKLGDRTVTVTGTIVRSIVFDPVVNQYDIGIKFHDLTDKDRAQIISFVFKKQRNIIQKGLV